MVSFEEAVQEISGMADLTEGADQKKVIQQAYKDLMSAHKRLGMGLFTAGEDATPKARANIEKAKSDNIELAMLLSGLLRKLKAAGY